MDSRGSLVPVGKRDPALALFCIVPEVVAIGPALLGKPHLGGHLVRPLKLLGRFPHLLICCRGSRRLILGLLGPSQRLGALGQYGSHHITSK